MQVLQISTTPVKYELEIEHARLEYNQDFQPSANVRTTAPTLKIDTKNASVRLNTYEARRSLGFATVGDRVKDAAQAGQDALSKYIRGSVIEGQQMSNIHEGANIATIASQQGLEMPQMQTTFLPQGGANISCEPSQINVDYQMGSTNYDWEIKSNSMSYVPGSVRLRIIERAEIDITYTGSPLYFPRSADPNYQEPAVG